MSRSAILPTTNKAYRQVCDGRTNPNGCPYLATMFTQAADTGRGARLGQELLKPCRRQRAAAAAGRRRPVPTPTPQHPADCSLANRLWRDGYEIATHTANHVAMPAGYPRNDTVAEILGARHYMSEECGIDSADIRGFRSPYLVTNPTVRQVRDA